MGPIQDGINQSLTILGALATQSPGLRQKAENRQLNKEYENLENQSSNIRDAFVAGFPEMEKAAMNLDEEGFKSATNKFNISVSDLENIAEQKKNLAIKLGKSEDYFKNVDEITSLNGFKENSKRNLNIFKTVNTAQNLHELYASKAAQESNNKLSTKQRIKVNMNMMKSTLKEDN